jgi:F-type H+-transporting ATPase subunit b
VAFSFHRNSLLGCLVAMALIGYGSSAVAQDGGHTADTVTAVAGETDAVGAPAAAGGGHDDHGGHADHGHGGHGGGHHDEYDPTSRNMTDQAEDAIEWRAEKSIATLIVFGLLLAGLTAFAWKPISKGLEARERGIANNIASAEKASKDAVARLAEYEAQLAGARTEAQQILADARKDAEAAGQRLIATAQEEAVRQRERAVAEIESAKRVALSELAEKSTDVAILLAQRVVGREVNASDHQNLIQEMLNKLPSQN